MRQIRVTAEFFDKYDSTRLFRVGDTLSFDDGRAADVVERHLAVYAEEPAPKKEEKKEPTLFEEPKAEPAVAEEPKAEDAGEKKEEVKPITKGKKK